MSELYQKYNFEKKFKVLKNFNEARFLGENKDSVISSLLKNCAAGKTDVSLKIDFYEYQKVGVGWLINRYFSERGSLLADDMGLGKTAQTIGLIVKVFQSVTEPKCLIVAPKSLMINWNREICRFTCGLKPYIHWGETRIGFKDILEDHKLIVTTYSTLVLDISLFSKLNYSLVVLDEASFVKNPDSERYNAVNSLNTDHLLAMTGTPFENSLLDIWAITNLISHNFIGTREEFHSEYGRLKLSEIQQKTINSLENKVSTIMLRRMKADVLEQLPSKVDVHRPLLMGEKERKQYNYLSSEIKNCLELKELALTKINTLRKFTSHPFLNSSYEGPLDIDTLRIGSRKFQYLEELLIKIKKLSEKAIIFANHKRILSVFEENLALSTGCPCFKIDGTTPVNERTQIIDDFSSLSGTAFLFLNPLAAGFGLNIQSANHVIHYSRQWNPAVEAQATARAYRNGQKETVYVYYLFYADTVEEKIHNRLYLKSEISESIIQPTLADIEELYLDLYLENNND